MTPRERVIAALARERPDRVPIDYSAVPEVTRRLQSHFQVFDKEALFQRLGVDFRIIEPRFLDAPGTPTASDGTYLDIWGVRHATRMTGGIQFHEFLEHPLANAQCIADLENYRWPRAECIDVSMTREQAQRYRKYAVVSGPWTPLFCQLFFLRGMEQTLEDMLVRPDMVHYMLDRITTFYFEAAVRILDQARGLVDIFFTGDDFASQKGLIISRDMFRAFFKGRFGRLFSLAKDYGCRIMMHSCGSIVDILPDFIEIGADIIDPVQVRASGMDIESLKAAFGHRIIFHGGIDQQHTLPFESADNVRCEVRRTINVLGSRGGYLLCSSHDLLDNIPTENILAMYEEAASSV